MTSLSLPPLKERFEEDDDRFVLEVGVAVERVLRLEELKRLSAEAERACPARLMALFSSV
jgi:hypothetical protein